MVFWLKVARELTSSFVKRCGIIHNLYHLGSAEDLRPHLLLAHTLAGFIAPAPSTSFEESAGFLFALGDARNCSERGIPVTSWAFLPLFELLVVPSVIIAESLSLPWTPSSK